jgi:hypothetical protein
MPLLADHSHYRHGSFTISFNQIHSPGKKISYFRISPSDAFQGLADADFTWILSPDGLGPGASMWWAIPLLPARISSKSIRVRNGGDDGVALDADQLLKLISLGVDSHEAGAQRGPSGLPPTSPGSDQSRLLAPVVALLATRPAPAEQVQHPGQRVNSVGKM